MLVEAFGPQALCEACHVERALVGLACARDTIADTDAQPVRERGVKARAFGRRLDDVRIDIPILGLVERAGSVVTQRRREVLAEAPAVRRAVVIDDAHLIVAEAVYAILVEKEFRVLD